MDKNALYFSYLSDGSSDKQFKIYFYFKNYVCVRESLCMRVQVPWETKDSEFPGAGGTGNCEPPHMGARK